MVSEFRRRVAASRLAPIAAFPTRARTVARHNWRSAATSLRWLFTSREHTNYTYNLTDRNRRHLEWWIADVTGTRHGEIRGYVAEILGDFDFVQHVQTVTARSARRGLADREVRLGRRIGWYAITRALKPMHVIETGTDKGLGSCVFAAALLRNGAGRLTTIDVNPASGYLITGKYADVVDRRIGDSVPVLRGAEPADVFIHDSLHTYSHERAELDAVPLTSKALVLSDNADQTDALLDWAEAAGRPFTYFAERPADHWFPGGGIGASPPMPG